MPGPLFFFFALVATATVATATYFAIRPTERTLGIVRPLCAATLYSALASFFAGIVNGLVALGRVFEGARDQASAAEVWKMAIAGFAESPIPLVAGFALVAVTWLLVAVGLRRMA